MSYYDKNYIFFDIINSSWTYYFSKLANNTHIQYMTFNNNIYPIKDITKYNSLTLRLEQYEGRSDFSITQQPNKNNGYKATIYTKHPFSGAHLYSIRLFIVSVT